MIVTSFNRNLADNFTSPTNVTDDSLTDDYVFVMIQGIIFGRGYTDLMFGISLTSALACLSILISYFLFWTHLMRKPSMEILFYVFLSNFLTSLGSMVGNPVSGSAACWFEGIITNVFTLSSILWTVVVVVLLYSVVAYKHPLAINLYFHVVCWGFPVLATFLPFVNSTYGAPEGMGWCWVIDLPNTPLWAPELWYWLSFYIWIWLAFFIIAALVSSIIYKMRSIKNETSKKFKAILFQLVGYPIIILICWLPSSISDLQIYSNPDLP